jgi:flagellar biosynthetic protein FlhB
VASEQGEKQYEATPHKREEARKKGRIARSREAGPAAATAAFVGALAAQAPACIQALRATFTSTIGDLDGATGGAARAPTALLLEGVASVAAPPLVAAALGAILVGVAQTRFAVSWSLAGFQAERLNPLPKLQEMFSPEHAAGETALSLMRVSVVGIVAYCAARGELPGLVRLSAVSLGAGGASLWAACGRVAAALVVALALLAAVEYAHAWLKLERELRMTRQELTDETKQQDGDPKMKQRIRARARALARKRSVRNVKDAAVIVTNPTHIAVALRYTAQDAAPVVISKGHDEVALEIRAEARKYGIPILENRPLARALDAEVEVGQFVPTAHFAAVARVLAFVYRLRGRVGTGIA